MNILIVDHHFDQDIEALGRVAGAHRMRVVPADMFGRLTRRYFPEEVFASVLGEAYASAKFADARERHFRDVLALLFELYTTFPFDVLIVPSDTIMSFRPFSRAAHELGSPFVVVQKETTISPYSMTEEARVIGRKLPFTGDLMLVCAENHKRFWINTGADPKRIIVTGQPRFDFYHQKDGWKGLAELGVQVNSALPTVLFLSYDVGAYSPEGWLTPTWLQLREETESILVELALAMPFNLIVKPHPQQQGIDRMRDRLAALAGQEWGRSIQLLPGRTDLRHLVVNVATVVGFQTTAMFEAMAAGKKVIYTFWSDPTWRYVSALIPFHEMKDALLVARSPEELRRMLLEPTSPSVDQQSRRVAEIELQLGPLDGQAARRVISELERYVNEYHTTAESRLRRLRWLKAASRARPRMLVRASLRMARWALLEAFLPLGYPLWRYTRKLFGRRHVMGQVSMYRDRCRQGRSEALDTLTYGVRSLSDDRA